MIKETKDTEKNVIKAIRQRCSVSKFLRKTPGAAYYFRKKVFHVNYSRFDKIIGDYSISTSTYVCVSMGDKC